ncbi:co-chaperone GroES family protein [Roseivirga sp.]|uniref:co-chaperone GroES n=1 Tax=Roseivirga sp. TaxID=1964215 RepID=UPI002B267A4A|nr:co-chaperone GroES family protein [Roseivirga sp.]
MELTADNKLRNLIIVGDRVLIRPKKQAEKTATGLYLPPGIQEKEKVQSGYIIKVGPGYPIPMPVEDSEPWKNNDEKIKYIPLQVEEGDLAIFLQREAIEIRYGNEKLFIVPQSSILMLERDETL